MHHCLLIPEIFFLVLEFVQQYDESPEEDVCRNDYTLSKRTLASLARTCRAFSPPALDLLWQRLDSLDPLIKLLPSRIWTKKRSLFVTQTRMRKNHWSTFRQYAVRVRTLHGPCRTIPPSLQHTAMTYLTQPIANSLPLLPNLTELVWDESDTYDIYDSTVPLIKYFAGPRVTTISLFRLPCPIRAMLPNLPILCPNVTSFTATFRLTFVNYSADIGDIIRKWPNLQVLGGCPLSQPIMDELASREMLNTFTVRVYGFFAEAHLHRLPAIIHTFSLETGNTLQCIWYLQTLHGTPTRFRLHLDHIFSSDMDTLFQMLPTRFDTAQLQDLSISLRTSPVRSFPPLSFPLSESLLASLHPFSALVALDLNTFCTSGLDDAAYERVATAWPELRSLKLGAADVSRALPVATVGAVIAVLRACPYLETLHIVFDGSVPPPASMTLLGAQPEGIWEGERVEDEVATSRARTWGISNQHITEIYVGHSPIVKDRKKLRDLVSCLKSVMPRLERIRSRKEPFGAAETWQTVQRLLAVDDMAHLEKLQLGSGPPQASRSRDGRGESRTTGKHSFGIHLIPLLEKYRQKSPK